MQKAKNTVAGVDCFFRLRRGSTAAEEQVRAIVMAKELTKPCLCTRARWTEYARGRLPKTARETLRHETLRAHAKLRCISAYSRGYLAEAQTVDS